jgi:hypothetical protein
MKTESPQKVGFSGGSQFWRISNGKDWQNLKIPILGMKELRERRGCEPLKSLDRRNFTLLYRSDFLCISVIAVSIVNFGSATPTGCGRF